MARKKGKARKAARKNLPVNDEDFKKAPHTFVFHRGVVGKNLFQLMLDMRRVMEPYTAATLRTRRKNVLKDFVSVAGQLGVSHFLSFSRSDANINMRIMRVPRGPPVTFRIRQYCLTKDIQSSLKKPNMYAGQFLQHPLLVLNNFSKDQPELKLSATLLQNMFPSINVHKVQLKDIRRCVLLNYDAESKEIEFRHYSIKVVPVGMSKSTKKLLQNKVPNLGRYQDVSEFFLNAGQLSESEAELDGDHNEAMTGRGNMVTQKSAIRLVEVRHVYANSAGQLSESEAELDGDHNEVTLPQAMTGRGNMVTQKSAIRLVEVRHVYANSAGQLSESEAELDGDHNEVTLPQAMTGRGNMVTQKSAIRLVEIGPRMRLQLVKIEEGLCEGEVIFHQFVTKTQEEVAAARDVRRKKKKLKERRKQTQEADVERKKHEKEAHRKKCMDGKKKKQRFDPDSKNEVAAEADDDTKYYREEVGEEPDPELFPQHKDGAARGGKRKPPRRDFSASRKKFKKSPNPNKDDKPDKASKSRSFSKDKWKMDSGAKPKGRVMNKRTVGGKGKPGMQGLKGKGKVLGGKVRGHGGKGRGQAAKFKFKMSKSKK